MGNASIYINIKTFVRRRMKRLLAFLYTSGHTTRKPHNNQLMPNK
jgi:hypothetical protein